MPKKPPARPAKPSPARSPTEGCEGRRRRGRAGQARPAAAGARDRAAACRGGDRRAAPPAAAAAPEGASRAADAGAAGREAPLPDFNLLSRNLAQLIEEGGKVLAAYLRPLESGDFAQPGEDVARMAATLGRVAEYYLSDAQRALAAQAELVAPVSRFVGLDLAPAAGRGGGAGRRARPRRQALRRSRMARKSLFRLPQAGLCADDALGRAIWSRAPTSSIRIRATRRSSICAR